MVTFYLHILSGLERKFISHCCRHLNMYVDVKHGECLATQMSEYNGHPNLFSLLSVLMAVFTAQLYLWTSHDVGTSMKVFPHIKRQNLSLWGSVCGQTKYGRRKVMGFLPVTYLWLTHSDRLASKLSGRVPVRKCTSCPSGGRDKRYLQT